MNDAREEQSARPERFDVLFCTFGSRGDVHPYVAVALALRELGITSAIATGKEHEATVRRAAGRDGHPGGIGFVSVPPSREEFDRDGGMMERVLDPVRGAEFIFGQIVNPFLERTHGATLAAAKAGGCRLIVGHPLAVTAPMVAQQLGLAYVYTFLQPMSMFSATDPPVIPAAPWLHGLRRLGPWAHRALYRLMARRLQSLGEPIERFARGLGLEPEPGRTLLQRLESRELNIAMFSPVVAPPQNDWPANTRAVGACLWDDPGAEDAAESAALEAFVRGGERPVVVTLGSAAVEIGRHVYEHALEGAVRAGRRCVLLTGPMEAPSAARRPGSEGRDVLAVRYGAFSRVLPAACAVVHSCGAGTMAQALRAGVPQVCVPFAHDQPDNAMRVRRLRAGVMMGRSATSAERMRRAIVRVLGEREGFIAGARAAAERVRGEDGARAAAGLIRDVLVRRG
jgi:rhamnosyltransferase subunit B